MTGNTNGDKKRSVTIDLRQKKRFRISLPLRYKLGDGTEGDGKSINISSNGALIETDSLLGLGQEIEASLAWPARLDDDEPIKLVLRAKVTRRANPLTEGRFRSVICYDWKTGYEFRTTGRENSAAQ